MKTTNRKANKLIEGHWYADVDNKLEYVEIIELLSYE